MTASDVMSLPISVELPRDEPLLHRSYSTRNGHLPAPRAVEKVARPRAERTA